MPSSENPGSPWGCQKRCHGLPSALPVALRGCGAPGGTGAGAVSEAGGAGGAGMSCWHGLGLIQLRAELWLLSHLWWHLTGDTEGTASDGDTRKGHLGTAQATLVLGLEEGAHRGLPALY